MILLETIKTRLKKLSLSTKIQLAEAREAILLRISKRTMLFAIYFQHNHYQKFVVINPEDFLLM